MSALPIESFEALLSSEELEQRMEFETTVGGSVGCSTGDGCSAEASITWTF